VYQVGISEGIILRCTAYQISRITQTIFTSLQLLLLLLVVVAAAAIVEVVVVVVVVVECESENDRMVSNALRQRAQKFGFEVNSLLA